MLSGDNSILNQAGRARDITGQKDVEEKIQIAYLGVLAEGNGKVKKSDFQTALENEFGAGKVTDLADNLSTVKIDGKEYETGVSGGGEDTKPTTIAEAKQASGETVTALSDKDTTPLEDDLGNIVKVPKGFGIAEGSGTKVEEGIVIEDADSTRQTYKSQFVWVPVGNGIKVSTEISASGTVDIPLGRYVFNTSTGAVDETLSKTEPSDQLKTSTSSSAYYTEGLTDATTINTHAKDIATFISSANSNKGYYIARYEAGISGTTENFGLETKTATDGSVKPQSRSGLGVWNSITQPNAADVCQSMYNTTNDKVTSDLVNSYAWDTAILFIQKCGNNGDDSSKYSIQRGYSAINTSAKQLTGENKLQYQPGGEIARSTAIFDTQCKICDMAGNIYEWTTETDSITSYPCVFRGDSYYRTSCYTANRDGNRTSYSDSSVGFRPLLYL